ncbi:hypothetical protein ACFPRL_10110 [Pseudoclavibacter helvolus]
MAGVFVEFVELGGNRDDLRHQRRVAELLVVADQVRHPLLADEVREQHGLVAVHLLELGGEVAGEGAHEGGELRRQVRGRGEAA